MKKPDNGILPLGSANLNTNQPDRHDDSNRNRQPTYSSPQNNYIPYSQPDNDRNTDQRNHGTNLASDKGGYDPYRYDQYEPETAAQRNPHAAEEDEEFHRRLEEYRRAEGNLNKANIDLAGPDMDGNNPYSYQNDFPQYTRDQNSPYQPHNEEYDPRNQPQDYNPYDRDEPQGPNPYKIGGQNAADNGYHPAATTDDKKAQRNYLVNNPIALDAPQKRATGGFRVHQEITHDSMGIARPNKISVTQGTATEAYQNIKKKYGNHSAQYNILTGT